MTSNVYYNVHGERAIDFETGKRTDPRSSHLGFSLDKLIHFGLLLLLLLLFLQNIGRFFDFLLDLFLHFA